MMLAIFFSQFVLTAILVKFFVKIAKPLKLLDCPNQRSSHYHPIPRGAGIVFVLVWVLGSLPFIIYSVEPVLEILNIMVCGLIIALVGFVDDIKNLSSKFRFLVQTIVVTVFLMPYLSYFLESSYGSLGFVLAIIAGVWSINLFNFMDGIDGIAGLEGVLVLGSAGVFALLSNSLTLAALSLGVVASVLGFLVFNLPKAKVFMGDVGSSFLGFIIAAISILGHIKYHIPIWYSLLIYSVFWMDTTLTLIRRMLKGEKWYEAHRKHAYQRLHHLARWSHAKILAFVSLINLILIGLSFGIFYQYFSIYVGFGAAALILSLYFTYVEWKAPFA